MTWTVGGLCQTGSNQQNATDLTPYESFLRQVVQLGNSSSRVAINGQPTDLPQPRLKDAIPLTDEEVELLNEVAAEAEARFRRLEDEVRPVMMEALFRTLESETEPARGRPDPASWRNQQQNRIDASRRRVLLEAVEQISKALGDSRFEMLDSHIRKGTLDGYIRSLRAAYPRPVRKKR